MEPGKTYHNFSTQISDSAAGEIVRDPVVAPAGTRQATASNDTSLGLGFVLAEDHPPGAVHAEKRYWLREELGRGGGGIVYRAWDESLGRDVALKILRHDFLHHARVVDRFVREAKLIVTLRHPGIPQVYDLGTSCDGRPFYTTRIVEGQDLRQRIETTPVAERGGLLNIFAQVCQIVAYTHAQQIVHLDLKPENIMVGKFGEVLLMDWGHAQRLQHDSSESGPRLPHVGGTLAYMAPEHAAGGAPQKQFDVFSLGATLCYLLTGSPPYVGACRDEVYRQALDGATQAALERLATCGFAAPLIRLASRCLERDAAERPADAEAVAQAMTTYYQSVAQRYESDIQRFFDISCDLFCIAGFDGFFQRVNINFPAMLGFSEQELLAHPFVEWVHPDDRARTLAQMDVLFQGKPVVRFRNRYRTTHNTYLTLEWTAKSIPAEKIIYAVARIV